MSETPQKKRYIVENHLSFSEKSGGFAFPCSNDKIFTTTDGEEITWSGMTLRDYFAARAITIPDTGAWNYTLASKDQVAARIASFAYMIADAMIAERKEEI
jgi:hypothetical protein